MAGGDFVVEVFEDGPDFVSKGVAINSGAQAEGFEVGEKVLINVAGEIVAGAGAAVIEFAVGGARAGPVGPAVFFV